MTTTVPALESELGPRLDELRRKLDEAPTEVSAAPPPFTPTPLERELYEEIARALSEWETSAEGQRELAELRGKSVEEIAYFLHTLGTGPRFARTWELIDVHGALPADEKSFIIKAATVGMSASAGFIVGAEVQLGVGIDPFDPLNFTKDVIFLSGSVFIGTEELLFGGVAFGIWAVTPLELKGFSLSVMAELAGIAGCAFELSFLAVPITILGVSVIFLGGEGLGIEGGTSYTIVWQHPWVFQPYATNYMILQTITCIESGEDTDELYFNFTIDGNLQYRFPTQGQNSMDDGHAWNCGRSIRFNDSVRIDLYDNDDVGDDPRGSHTYYPDQSFSNRVTVSGKDGSYTLQAILNPIWQAWVYGGTINGNDSTLTTPAACELNGALYVFWRASNNSNAIYFSASPTGQAPWPNGKTFNSTDTTPNAPAACAFDQQLYVLWRGNDSYIYCSASPTGEAPWPNGASIGPDLTSASPSACEFKQALYVFWTDASTHVISYRTRASSSDPWSSKRTLSSSVTTQPIAVCAFGNYLYAFWLDASRQVFWSRSSDGVSWEAAKSVNTSESSNTAPSACVADGVQYVFWTSTNSDNGVLWSASQNGTAWTNNVSVPSAVSTVGTGATTYEDTPYVFWVNSANQMCFSK